MKLKAYTTKTARSHNKCDVAYISINTAGSISFSRAAIEALKMKENSRIAFFQNEDSPEDWYLHLEDREHYFPVRKKGENGLLMIQNSTTAQDLYRTSKPVVWEKKSMRLRIKEKPVSIDGEVYYLIITKPMTS